MIDCWKYRLDYKHVIARKAVNCLLVGKSTWRGWDSWWSQVIDFGWFNTIQFQVSCVAWFRGTSFWLARFVRVGYFMVDNTILYTWSSPGFLMAAPCATHRSSWVKQRAKLTSTKVIQQCHQLAVPISGDPGRVFFRFLTWGNLIFFKKRFHGGHEFRNHDQKLKSFRRCHILRHKSVGLLVKVIPYPNCAT